jgi:hypothetical protein
MPSIRQSIRSSTPSKRPTSAIADGQIALNTASGTPGMFFKDNANNIIKTGPAHYGATAPNSSPAVSGSTGNSIGEAWLDNGLTPPGWKIWNGSAWVNATPLSSDTVQGLIELATNAEVQAGVDTARAVTAAGLQSKLSDSISTTSASGIASSTAVKAAYDLANAALPKSGGIITGNLEIGHTGSFTFEGATADAFETTLAAVDPTADRTITLPDTTGTVVTTGDAGTITSAMIANGTIVDADINSSAAIAFSKLASLASANILVGNASGVPTSTTVSGDVTITNAGVTAIASDAIVNADINSAAAIAYSKLALASGIVNTDISASAAVVYSKLALSNSIVNADINSAAAIVDTKLATIATAGKVSNSATTATNVNTASTIVARDASGNFSAGTITATLSGNASTVTTNANLTGDITSVGNATSIAAGVIVDADINASAGIVDTKLATIATAGKVSNSATTATNTNTASTIVARDASGNFSAGTITAALAGNASTVTTNANLTGDVTSVGNATAIASNVIVNADINSAAAIAYSKLALSSSIVNADISTSAAVVYSKLALSNSIVNADINSAAAIVDTKLATIATAGKVSNSATTATNANTANAIVARDASGNFSAGTITAALAGNASTVTTNANLTGDVTSVGNATSIAAGVIVDSDINASAGIVDTKLATIATAGKVSNSATTATSANTGSAIVARDGSGNFSAGTITAALTGAASSNVLKAGDTLTGPLLVAAGTVSLPGLAVAGDSNTGFYSPSADTLVLVTGGVERYRTTSGGRFQVAGPYDGNITAVAALDLDLSTSNYFTKTINANSTFTVSNTPASRAFAFTLELTHTSGTITWFSGVEWPGGTAPTLTTGKTHLFMFVTDDGGSRWRGASLINYTT